MLKRKITKLILTLFLLCLGYGAFHGLKYYHRCMHWPHQYPFISANGYRAIADFRYDQAEKIKIFLTGKTFDPQAVQDGAIIFIKNDDFYLDHFFKKVHPHINAHYILLTSDGDRDVPGAYASYLSDDKIIAWFSHNVSDVSHTKMHSLPIGIMGTLNSRNMTDDPCDIWGKILLDIHAGRLKKEHLIYCNVVLKTNITERLQAQEYFFKQEFCTKASGGVPYEEYVRQMARHKFVVSPHGRGLDCYRTWEALMLGSIPVVKRSVLDCLYEDLPVLIVDSWEEVTEELLLKTWDKFSRHTFKLDKLSILYWIDRIQEQKAAWLKQF